MFILISILTVLRSKQFWQAGTQETCNKVNIKVQYWTECTG